MVRTLTREEARRIAVRAQALDAERPKDLAEVLERLTLLQLDPTAAVAPSADLVAWSRIGGAYSPDHLRRAVDERTAFEHVVQESETEPAVAMVRPMSDLRLFLARMRAWPARDGQQVSFMAGNAGFRRRVLDQLREEGPLTSREIPDTAEVPWVSSGWTNDRNVTQMLQFLAAKGEVAVVGRRGRQRVWDVAERVFPPDVEAVPAEEALRIRAERRLRSLGVARERIVGDAGVPARVEGTDGEWRLDPGATAEAFSGRTALLSPFDRLIHHRPRTLELFDFDYLLEMYKPAAKRRWGYFALPVLHGDRLVGKVDAKADRKAGHLVLHAVHEDVPFTPAMADGVHAELEALAAWLGLDGVRPA